MDIFQVNLLKKIVLFRLKLPKINKAEAVNGAYFITTQLKSNGFESKTKKLPLKQTLHSANC